MDVSAIIVILVLTALALGAIVWMEMHSRRAQLETASTDESSPEIEGRDSSRRVARNRANRS